MSKKEAVTEHVLIPKHTKLNQKEKEEVLTKYNIAETQLPKISLNDPAISDLDVKLGDIIEVERNSKTAGKISFYRVVVSGK